MNTIHPDTMRLNHLLRMDHATLSLPTVDGEPAVEEIHFIYDATPGMSLEDSLRVAIDKSTEVTSRIKTASITDLTPSPRINYVFLSGGSNPFSDADNRRFMVIEHDQPEPGFKPCPFCGGSAHKVEVNPNEYAVECVNCGAASPIYIALMDDVEDRLQEMWNRRADLPPTSPPPPAISIELPITGEKI